MREIVHLQAGQCGNQIGAKVIITKIILNKTLLSVLNVKVIIFSGRNFVDRGIIFSGSDMIILT